MHRGTRESRPIFWLIALMVGLTAALAGDRGLAQSIEDMIDRAEEYQAICYWNGGRSDRVDHTFGAEEQEWIRVECVGGLLDGRTCISRFRLEDSWCVFGLTAPTDAESAPDRPEAAIDLVGYEPVRSLDMVLIDDRPWWERCSILTGRCWPWVMSPQEPITGTAVLMSNQPGSSPESTALEQVNGCLAHGGEPQASQDGSGLIVTCAGGLMDGLWCMIGSWGQVCSLFEIPVADTTPPVVTDAIADPTPTFPPPPPVEPAPTQPVPTPTQPMPTPTTEPTVMPTPTLTPVEPTVVPTLAPPPPSNDNAVPPGKAEDPDEAQPSPTVVVLT